ncbi:hypothetical protein ACWEH1_19755 [Micromonospora chersina]
MIGNETGAVGGAGPGETSFPLVIGVTPSPAERVRLTELLDGVAPLLLVADLDELRRLITPSGPPAPVGPPPAVAPAPRAPDDALVVDGTRSTARWGNREVVLTRLERDLLACLSAEPVRVWSYAELHRSVWHDEGLQRKADPKVDGICDIDGGKLYQREDDNPETVSNRLSVNVKQSKPILEYYNNKGVLKNIDGSKDIDEVTNDVIDILDHL